MQLFQAWVESLTLFKPQNFKLFLLVTLKSIIETYQVLFAKFWPIVIGSLVVDIGAYYLLAQQGNNDFQVQSFFTVLVWVSIFTLAALGLMALCMTLLLCVRPSASIKNWSYLFSYWRHFIYFVFIWLIAMICKSLSLILFIYWIFFAAFLLDSDAHLKSVGLSFWRSLKMVAYNLPFIVISAMVFSLLSSPIVMIFGAGSFMLTPWEFVFRFVIVNLIQLPLLFCFYINFYLKKIHEQFNLYFPVKGQ